MDSLLTLFGKMHILILHLPIGALVFLALFRSVPLLRQSSLQLAHNALWIIAASTTVIAAITGWALILEQGNAWGQLGVRHQWLGTSLAVIVVTACLFALSGKHPFSDGGLVIACVVMVATAHHGGSMTHGKEYLWGSSTAEPGAISTSDDQDDSVTAPSPPQPMVDPTLWADANALFKHYCIDCHNSNRRRGYFDISSHEAIFKGGSSGQAVRPGDPKNSLLMKLIILPEDHFDRMPPDGDPLTADEIETIRLWIRAGAPDEHGQIAHQ